MKNKSLYAKCCVCDTFIRLSDGQVAAYGPSPTAVVVTGINGKGAGG